MARAGWSRKQQLQAAILNSFASLDFLRSFLGFLVLVFFDFLSLLLSLFCSVSLLVYPLPFFFCQTSLVVLLNISIC